MADGSLLYVHVHVHVKPNDVEAFKAATLVNARNSVQESGCKRFDVIQNRDDANRFVLVEVYTGPEAAASHKETQHYLTWRDTVADLMAEPRRAEKFVNLHPDDAGF